MESARESKDWTPRHNFRPPGVNVPHHFYGRSSNYGHHGVPTMDAAQTTTFSRDEPPSVSNASEMQAEWIEEDETGVYITIRQQAEGTRELRRIRFRYNKHRKDFTVGVNRLMLKASDYSGYRFRIPV
ncbi:hypothetical protein HID58_080066 [Brassica napus]|uniref:BRX domain-containing protein n=1 Tax=Brassica napus TaxID=3708 RepID=A0ABQ7Y3U7_BRANA|nr:hypothetical protein HID58_080066 [Brassica napus]